MEFYTQFNACEMPREKTSSKTLVSMVPCSSNQERIAQALLTGSLVQAANTGYDFKSDEEIQDIMFDVSKRNIDIVDRLQAVQIVRQKVEDYIKGKLSENPDTLDPEVHAVPEKVVPTAEEPEGKV